MKLFRVAGYAGVKTAVMIGNTMYDTSSFGEDYGELFFATEGLQRLKSFVTNNLEQLPVLPPNCKLLPPVARPSKIVCVGLNYVDHAQETGQSPPKEPVIFLKSTSAYSGPFDDILIPANSVKTDWEVELAVVIGRKASYVPVSEAMDHIAGFTVHNDVSERHFQLEKGGTWDKGKGCDSFAPMGPCLVTPDELRDVNRLVLWLKVNGQLKQRSNTSQLIFSIPYLISYISHFMTLLPGDIISTGTPAGVGMGFSPPVYLRDGDVVELGIEGIGFIRQHVRRHYSIVH